MLRCDWLQQIAFGLTSPYLLRSDDKFKDMHVSMATMQTSIKLVVPAHTDQSQLQMGGASAKGYAHNYS